MLRRIMCFALCFCVLPLSGCSKARHIDSAALAETITVERRGSAKIYTFYLLSGKERYQAGDRHCLKPAHNCMAVIYPKTE